MLVTLWDQRVNYIWCYKGRLSSGSLQSIHLNKWRSNILLYLHYHSFLVAFNISQLPLHDVSYNVTLNMDYAIIV